MRRDDSSYRPRHTLEPRASIVDLPNPAPLGKGRGSDGRSRLIVALLGAFVVVALLKPWEALRQESSLPQPSPSSQAATPGPTGAPPPNRAPAAQRVDWSVAGPVMQRHDSWGLRALVLQSGALAATVSTASSASLGDLHAAEVWTAATPSDIGPHAPAATPSSTGQVISDAVLLRTQGAPVAAIGVTSPDDQPVIDIRVWRIVNAQAFRIDAQDLPGNAPGVDRLLIPPAGLDPSGLWPPGLYHIDLLVRQKVLSVTVFLPPLLHDQTQIARITELAQALPPGPFVVSTAKPGSGLDYLVTAVVTSSVPQLGEAAAWLKLTGLTPRAGAPDAATITTDGSIVALGLRGAPGEKLASTVLVNLAPLTPHTLTGLVVDSPTSDIVIYELGPDGLPAGVYQVESSWFKGSVGQERNLYLDVRGPSAPVDANAPFLVAARQWAMFGGESLVLASGISPIAELPNRVAPDPDRLGATCPGAALMNGEQKVIGIGYTGATPRDIRVDRLYAAGQVAQVAAAIASDTVPGLILMADTTSQTWRPGYYQVSLGRNGNTDRIIFCVGKADASGIVRVPAGAGNPPGSGQVAAP